MCDDLGEDFSSDIDVSDTEDFSDDFDDASVDDFSDDIEDISEDDFSDDLDDVSDDDFSNDIEDISEDDFADDLDDVSDDEFSDDIEDISEDDFADDLDDVSDDEFSDDIEDISEDDFVDDFDDVSDDDFSDDIEDISEDDSADNFVDASDDESVDDMQDVSDDISEDENVDDIPEDEIVDDMQDISDDISEDEIVSDTQDVSDDIPEDENVNDVPEDEIVSDTQDVSDDIPEDENVNDVPEDEIVSDTQDVSDDIPEDENVNDIPEDEIVSDTKDVSDDIPENETANDPENTSNDISNALHDEFNDFSTLNNENDNIEQSEVKSYDNLSGYMSDHNYGMDDYDTYSQDPVWRDLHRKEFLDSELPPLTQESAKSQLYDYMTEHNYGQDDFNTYSQDPKWRDLQSAAFPDYELPPLVEEKSDIGLNENGRELTPANTIVDVNEFHNFNLDDEYEKLSSLDVKDLSKDEISSLERYSGSGYSRINRSLYDNEYRPLSTYEKELNEKDINTLTNCISRKEIPFDFKAYRGIDNMEFVFGDDANNMSLEELNKKYSGTYFVNKGFSSVSTDYDVANDFLGYSNKGGVMTIDVPKGSKGIAMGDVSVFKNGEKEVLLQRGSAYQIKSIDMDDNNRLRLHTKLVGQFGG